MKLLSAATPECCLCVKASNTQQITNIRLYNQLFNIKLIIFFAYPPSEQLSRQLCSFSRCECMRNKYEAMWKNTGKEKLFLRSSRCLRGCRPLLCHDDWPSFSSAATGLLINDIVEKSMYCWSYWKGWICLIKLSQQSLALLPFMQRPVKLRGCKSGVIWYSCGTLAALCLPALWMPACAHRHRLPLVLSVCDREVLWWILLIFVWLSSQLASRERS